MSTSYKKGKSHTITAAGKGKMYRKRKVVSKITFLWQAWPSMAAWYFVT